jgi:Flp pilus assembly protein TadD
LALNPNLHDALVQIATTYIAKGEAEKAIERVRTQLRTSPNDPFLHDLLGRIFLTLNRDDMAEEAFMKAIEVNESFFSAYIHLAYLYARQQAHERAIQQCQAVIKANPQLLPPYMLLGVVYDQQGQHQKANEQYEHALKINPKFAPAANNLAWNYAEYGGNIDIALALAQTAKEQLPDNPAVSDTLGWIYYKKNVFLKAVGLLKDSVEQQPDNPVYHYHLGMAYYKNGDGVQARQALNQALQLGRDFPGAPEARATLASLR